MRVLPSTLDASRLTHNVLAIYIQICDLTNINQHLERKGEDALRTTLYALRPTLHAFPSVIARSPLHDCLLNMIADDEAISIDAIRRTQYPLRVTLYAQKSIPATP